MRRRRFVHPLMVVLGALVFAAPVAAAPEPIPVDTSNLAGRPISGGYDANIHGGNCQGIAYGRVDGRLVLFTANHCRFSNGVINPEDRSGQPVYGPNGSRIGVWGPTSTVASTHDLTFIYIDAAAKPANTNRIYRGPYNGAGGVDDWWVMTGQPTVDMGCDGTWKEDFSWQMAQPKSGALNTVFTTRAAYLWRIVNVNSGSGVTRHCQIEMSGLQDRTGYVESGSPVMNEDWTNRLFGYIVNDWTAVPMYHGIEHFDAFYGGDTRLCVTASCS